MAANPAAQPNPGLIFDTLTAYQKSMALQAAIKLELFTHIAEGATTAPALAGRTSASERGVRILCDYLTVQGFLTKQNGIYGLSPDSAAFLNKHSPAYMGSMGNFLTHEVLRAEFDDTAAVVRKGGTVKQDTAALRGNPVWVEFAHAMSPMARMSGRVIAPMVADAGKPMKVLDIAASHGLYGISVALHNPAAEIVGVDWENVLEAAVENAAAAGVANRYRTMPGSAFEVNFGTGYDLVLIANFLHHFNPSTNVKFLKKVRAAMKPGGKVATAEFVPNEDRVSPPQAASFSLVMLASTEHGDAYTFREFDQMFREAGFGESMLHSLDPIPQRLILTSN